MTYQYLFNKLEINILESIDQKLIEIKNCILTNISYNLLIDLPLEIQQYQHRYIKNKIFTNDFIQKILNILLLKLNITNIISITFNHYNFSKVKLSITPLH